ncbi:MAG: Hsp33 family molecular chaperone HslO [Christensenellaceae bacterium]|nr:Hsp33 family molecular chaperone HslO [Christensenellaceae bacterium]
MSNTIKFPYKNNKEDRIVHATIADGQASILIIEAKNTIAKAASIHNTSPVCTAAFGRTLIATAMLGVRLKSDKSSVTVTVDGGGPIGKITAVSNGKTLKGYLSVPNIIVPNRTDGKLDVAAVVGTDGLITVVKDMGMKAPYIGQTEMVSGEIGEDFALYFMKSEQQPSIVSLGVLVSGDHVLSAGGVLVAPLPGCSDEVLDALEVRTMLMSDISHDLLDNDGETLIEKWFGGLDPIILGVSPLDYVCDCSKERMEKALISLGKKELQEIADDDQEGVEMICHFCHKNHYFNNEEILQLIKKI